MSTNDITGDKLKSKVPTEQYRNGFDAIDWSVKDDSIDFKNKGTQTSQPKPDYLYLPLRD